MLYFYLVYFTFITKVKLIFLNYVQNTDHSEHKYLVISG